MGSGLVILIIIIVIVVVLGLVVLAAYNGLVSLRARVDEAWSDITVQQKRRADLIPNLIESVKGYAAHERGVFDEVTQARSATLTAKNPAEAGQAENKFHQALGNLFAVAENYPQLQANTNFLQLQGELVDTENKIQAARRFYNGGVRDFNTKVQQFPNVLFARGIGFQERQFFEVENPASIQEPPQVKF